MKSDKMAILTCLILIFSSIAGCLEDEGVEEIQEMDDQEMDDSMNDGNTTVENNITVDNETVEIQTLGDVLVSTYHVQQLVSAIGGEHINVQIISPSNVPVHDFEPSAADLITLMETDLFLYHGLNLEPWVGPTLEALGSDAPTAVQTHAMPSGEATLDYESMLIADLCEHLSEGPYENIELAGEEGHAEDVEIHAEHVTHSLSIPEDDGDDHDDEDHDDHDEDEHDDDEDHDDHDGHDDHDEHDDHDHTGAEVTIENPAGCPSGTVIMIFHLEEGEHVLEFESEDTHDFDMVALKMPGGHAHHHHGHDEHDEHDDHDEMTAEEAMESFDTNNDSHLSWDEFWAAWIAGGDDHDEHDEHDDDNETDDGHDHDGEHDEHDDHHDEEEVLMEMFNMSDVDGDQLLNMSELGTFIELLEDGHDDHHDDHEEHDGMFGYATIHIEEEGEYGFALPMDVELFILMGEGGHDDHGHDSHDGHGEDSAMVCYDISSHTTNSSYLNQADCESAGLMWVAGNSGPDGHDDHHEGSCHNTTTHENYDSNEADCEAAGHMWMEDDEEHGEHEGSCHNTTTHENYDSNEADCEAAGHMWMDEHSDQEIISIDDEEFDFDPHSWLDPLAYKAQVGVVLDALIVAFPSGEATFTENAAAYMAQLDSLHSDFDSAFGSTNTCTGTSIAANHNAYAYMAQRYDLEFVTVHGLDPEGEPSAADILEVIERIEEEGITVFFVEEYTSGTAVSAILEQTDGIEIKTLYTMELQPSDSEDDYISMMRKNLEGLKSGLGC